MAQLNTLTKSSLYIASAISLALLGGCGGGSQTGTDFQDAGNFLGPGNKELDPTNDTGVRVGIFLVDEVEGAKRTLSQIAQQNSPAVALIDDGSKGDVVRFNQVAFLSAACLGKDCPTYAEVEADIAKEKTRLEAEKDALDSSIPAEKAEIAKLDHQIKQLEINEKLAAESFNYVNVYRRTFKGMTPYSIDDEPSAGKAAINDAGLTKIDGEWINGKLVSTGGSIDRRFSAIAALGNNNNVYYRQPYAAGWSYQTFFRYYSTPKAPALETRRDLLQGYQSIGFPTPEMPKRGYADYSGIAHALYNGYQVTMLNDIHADFAGRSLDYKTSETAILHTFDKGKHYIQKRPDLDLSGSASWAKGVPDFQGRIRSADGRLNGTLQGRFYGPQAAEVGGIFGLTGNNDAYYIGGFGAKRN